MESFLLLWGDESGELVLGGDEFGNLLLWGDEARDTHDGWSHGEEARLRKRLKQFQEREGKRRKLRERKLEDALAAAYRKVLGLVEEAPPEVNAGQLELAPPLAPEPLTGLTELKAELRYVKELIAWYEWLAEQAQADEEDVELLLLAA